MKRELAIELGTYLVVFSAIWLVSPWVAKTIDRHFQFYNGFITNDPILLAVGFALILGGSALAVWTIVLFRSVGKGTPNPKLPPTVFVVIGPYRYTRNPMALGGLLILLGEAAVYFSLTLVIIAVLYGVIIYLNAMLIEEPELRKRFGEPYEKYLTQVPRFFPIPWKIIQKPLRGN